MATGQHGPSGRSEEVVNLAADTLGVGFGDDTGLAGQARERLTWWQADEHFDDDRMVVVPVIGE